MWQRNSGFVMKYSHALWTTASKIIKERSQRQKKIISTSPSNCSPIKVQINKKNIIYRFSSDYSVLHTYTKFDKIQKYISNSNKIVKTSSNILTCSNNKKEGRRKVGTVANIWVAILWAKTIFQKLNIGAWSACLPFELNMFFQTIYSKGEDERAFFFRVTTRTNGDNREC